MTDPADPLAALLLVDLPPAAPAAVAAFDLSARERHALGVALGPDLGLIACPPGTDRPAFAAAIAREAVGRGERVLVLAQSPGDADAVLARLLDADLGAGRAAFPGEPADPDHGAAAHLADLDAARRRLADQQERAAATLRTARAAADSLPRLRELAHALADLSRAADAVRDDPDPARDADLAALDAAHAADRAKQPAKPGGLLGAVKGLFAKAPAGDDGAYLAARDKLRTDAADRRRAELLGQQAEALEAFRTAGRAVAAAGPAAPTPAGLEATAAAVGTLLAAAEAAAADAEAVVRRFDADRPRREREAWAGVPAVVGPAHGSADPLLAGRFDRVVVTCADRLDDDALRRAGRLAGRWALLGAEPGGRGKPTLFRRLWGRFAPPAVWAADGPLLVAALSSHDPAAVRREPLADRPEVELRFTPAGDLVAVAFPPTATLADAKALLAAELGLVALGCCGPAVWHDGPGRLAVCWSAADADGADAADLGGGVRELVSGPGPDALTAAVEFDPARWTRPQAEGWLLAHAPPARAARLPAPVLVAAD